MLNANAIRNNYPLRTVTLTVPSVTLAQLFVQPTATEFITLDLTINPFVTDVMTDDSTYTSNLLRAPLFVKPELNKGNR